MTTIHTRQLQQYTRPTNNNYTQDNLKKCATLYTLLKTLTIKLPYAIYFRYIKSKGFITVYQHVAIFTLCS